MNYVIVNAEQVVVDKYLNVVTEEQNVLTRHEVKNVELDAMTSNPCMIVDLSDGTSYTVYSSLEVLEDAVREFLDYIKKRG